MVGPCFQHDSCQIQHYKDNTKAFIWTEEELYCPWENAVLYPLISKAFLFSYTHPLKNIYLIGFRILVKYELNHLYSSSLSVIWHMCSSPSKLILSSTLTLQDGLCLFTTDITTSSILTSICPSLTIYTSLWYKWACDAGIQIISLLLEHLRVCTQFWGFVWYSVTFQVQWARSISVLHSLCL